MILKQTYDVNEILAEPMPQMEIIEFNKAEESIVIYRSKKTNTTDPYTFYIQAMIKRHQDMDIQTFIDNESHAKPITKEGLFTSVQKLLSKLDEKYEFKLNGEFIDALEFEEENSGQTFLCETTEEIVFVNWTII